MSLYEIPFRMGFAKREAELVHISLAKCRIIVRVKLVFIKIPYSSNEFNEKDPLILSVCYHKYCILHRHFWQTL